MKYKSFLALAAIGFIGNIQAATVGMVPDPINVTLGDTFTVDIVASDFDAVDSGGLNIHFDPTILQLNSASVDRAVWTSPGSIISNIDNTNGEIPSMHFSSTDDVTGEARISTLFFTAIDVGTSPLQLSPLDLYPFARVEGEGVTRLPVTLENGAINVVSAVPLPAAAWFMLSGLGMLAGWNHRRRVSPIVA